MPRRDWRLRVADMNLAVLGEAAAHTPDEVVRRWPDVPWRMMRDMRDLIIHEYFGVNPDIVWGTIVDDLPVVLGELRRLAESERPGQG